MGFKDYFHPVEKNAATQNAAAQAMAPQRSTFSAFPSLSSKKSRAQQASTPVPPNPVELSSVPPPRPPFNRMSSHMSTSGPAYPTGDFRNSSVQQVADLKADVMSNWLYHQQQERMWTHGGWDEGVILKRSKDDYVCYPPILQQQRNGFFDSVKKLSVKVASPLSLGEMPEADHHSVL